MTELRWKSATQLIELLESGEVSSVELVSECISNIERGDSDINAIVVRDFDRARERAVESDNRRAGGEALGPLHGLPMTVKESFQVAGLPTTWGLRDPATSVTDFTAAAVRRLEAAGAIILGKSNVPTVLADCQTFNSTYGVTRNPWDLTRTPGGSSGGSAAALAAGFVPLELGSDLAGSIRTPSHFCGVFGHRSSFGAISADGHAMPGVLAPADISVPGPMARTAEDLSLAFSVLAEVDGPATSDFRLSDLRIAVLTAHPLCEVSTDTLDCMADLTDALRGRGAEIVDNPEIPFDLVRAHRDFMHAFRSIGIGAMPSQAIAPLIEQAANLDPEDWSYGASAARTAALRHAEWLALNERRYQYIAAWRSFFQDHDALLCPVHSRTAFPHITDIPRERRTITVNGKDQDYNDFLFWAGLSALSYLPSTVMPIGLARDGLPVGVQVIGDHLADRHTIEVSRQIARERDGISYPSSFGVGASLTASAASVPTASRAKR